MIATIRGSDGKMNVFLCIQRELTCVDSENRVQMWREGGGKKEMLVTVWTRCCGLA